MSWKSIFRHIVINENKISPLNTIEVRCFQDANLDVDKDWQNWAREPGKTGRKDAYIDLEGARLFVQG